MTKTAGLYATQEWRRKSVKAGVDKFRKKRRVDMIAHAGGKCAKCGYDKCPQALEFHHRDPFDKSFKLDGSALNKRWERIIAEMAKCDLLCANCHREIHWLLES